MLIASASSAQITLNNSDVVEVGKKIVLGTNIDSSYTPQINTSNQTWDFSTLTSDEDEVWDVQKTEWNSFYPQFTNSNVTLKNNDTYQFINLDATALKACGTRVYNQLIDSFATVKFNTPETLIQFPASINGTFNTNSKFTVVINYSISFPYSTPFGTINVDVDKIKISANRVRTVTNDAEGNLITPLGTFSALRIKEYLIETDSIYANVIAPFALGYIALPNNAFPGISNPIIDTTTSYNWWAKDKGYSLLSFSYDNSKSRNVKWLKATPVISGIEDFSAKEISLVPNPSYGKIMINMSDDNIKEIVIYSITGTLVKRYTLIKGNQEIDLSNIEQGTYFCNIIGSDNSIIGNEKIILFNR